MKIKQKTFYSITPNLQLFTLSNDGGVEVSITNYGGIVTALKVPDRYGKSADIVLGFDDLEAYLVEHPYFGGIVGRSANRIHKGKFQLGAQSVFLSQNEGQNHLHGGFKGFDRQFWRVETAIVDSEKATLKLQYLSKDGEEGYTGNLNCTVTFSLSSHNELTIHYHCTTDQNTIVNLTHHDYFNLKDGGKSSIHGHELTIYADAITPTDSAGIPTGGVVYLDGHIADFRPQNPLKTIGDRLPNKVIPFGFDHNYVLQQSSEKSLRHAADLYEASSGRLLQIWTTQPALQLYTAGHFKGILGKNKTLYGAYHGLCLEGQYFPDTPNHAHFPSTILKVGELYEERYVMRFSTL